MAVLKFKSVFVLIGIAILAGEALGNQEELKVFEKMDVETWQTLAEFIANMKYKEIFAAIDKDGNGGISRQELAEYMVQLAWTGVGHGMDVSGQVWDSIAGEDEEIQMEELNQLFDFILSHNPIQMSNTTQPE